MSDQLRKSPKQEISETTANRVKQYIEQEKAVEKMLRRFPHLPNQEKEENRKAVLQKVQELERFFDLIFPFITNIRSYVSKVTDQNRATACYFLFGKAAQGFRAIFLLAQEGYFYKVMEILRGIRESLDLVHFFSDEEEDSHNLKKWFSGEIIENSIARAAHDKFLNQELPDIESQIPYKEAQAHIYRLYSLYSHISYSALLDSFDSYNRDFDFQKLSAFHYINNGALALVRGTLETAIIALKHFYRVAKDLAAYGELNKILGQLSPRFLSRTYEERVKQQTASMRKRFPRR